MRTYQNVLAVLVIVLVSGCSSIMGKAAPVLYLPGEVEYDSPGFFGKVLPDKGDPMIKRTCKIEGAKFPCTFMMHRGSYYVFKTNENGYITLEYRILRQRGLILTYKEEEAL